MLIKVKTEKPHIIRWCSSICGSTSAHKNISPASFADFFYKDMWSCSGRRNNNNSPGFFSASKDSHLGGNERFDVIFEQLINPRLQSISILIKFCMSQFIVRDSENYEAVISIRIIVDICNGGNVFQ